jgi:hypothetical protein
MPAGDRRYFPPSLASRGRATSAQTVQGSNSTKRARQRATVRADGFLVLPRGVLWHGRPAGYELLHGARDPMGEYAARRSGQLRRRRRRVECALLTAHTVHASRLHMSRMLAADTYAAALSLCCRCGSALLHSPLWLPAVGHPARPTLCAPTPDRRRIPRSESARGRRRRCSNIH